MKRHKKLERQITDYLNYTLADSRDVLPLVAEHDPVLWQGDTPLLVLTDGIVAYRARGRSWNLH